LTFPTWKTRAAAVVASATWERLKTALENEDSPRTSIGSKQPAKATIAAKAGGKRRAAARETGKDMVRVTPFPTRTSIRSAARATAAQRAISDHLPSRARRSDETSSARKIKMLRDEANWNIRIANESSTPRVVEFCKVPGVVVAEAIPSPDPLAPAPGDSYARRLSTGKVSCVERVTSKANPHVRRPKGFL